jgi:hypothetical protein
MPHLAASAADILPDASKVSGWIPVLSDFLAFVSTNWQPLAFLASGIAVFGLRVGPRDKPWYEVHGILRSLWVGAQNVGLVGEALRRIEGKLDRALRRMPDSDAPPSRAAMPSNAGA